MQLRCTVRSSLVRCWKTGRCSCDEGEQSREQSREQSGLERLGVGRYAAWLQHNWGVCCKILQQGKNTHDSHKKILVANM